MPLKKLQLRPGVNRESTTYANEGGWFESDKIRFRSGQPEKIGGWTNLAAQNNGTFYTYVGVNRDMCNWVTLSYANLNGIGTNQKYYVENGGKYYDITPLTSSSPVTLTNPFSTISGSKQVTVTAAGSGVSPGTWVTFSGATTVGGLTLNGEYEVISTPDGNTFTIISSSAATSTATSVGSVTANYQINAGNATYSVSNGFGTGPWNGVTFGAASTTLSANLYYLNTVSASGTGTTATIVFTAQPAAPFSVGSQIIVSGMTPSGYNGTFTVTACTTTSVSYANATTGAQTVAGSITPTTISVVSTSGFPASGTIVIESEIITYTGTTATSFTGCTRSTVNATIHSSGITVSQYSAQTGSPLAFAWNEVCTQANGIGTQLRTWSSDNFGQDLVFAPRGGAIYYWVPDTSTTPARGITLQKAAQNAGYTNYQYVPNTTLAVISSDVQRFVIALGANPYTPSVPSSTFDPMLVRWSDQQNAYQWVPASTNQAGEYRLQGGSTIVTGVASKQEILIWTDAALFSMQYLGPPYVWGFNQLMNNISIISPNAVASVNNQSFWMGVDKFYVYDGRVNTLPCTLRQYVFNDINQDQAYQIVAGTNEGFNEVWWMYPSYGSPVNDRYVVYNHLEQIWYYGNINRTAWLDSALRQFPMGAFSVQNTYLDSDITSTQTSITVLNGYSYPESGTLIIDSEYIDYTGHDRSQGNTISNCVRGAVNPVTKVASTKASHTKYTPVTFCTPNQVMYHENGTDDGSLTVLQPIEAYVQSSDFDIGDGYNFGFINRMLPDVTFDGSTVSAPQLTISVRPRQNSGTNYGVGDAPAVVSGNNYSNPLVHNYLVQLFTGQVYTRIRGRQMAFKVRSTDLGVAWQLGATRIDFRPDGRR